MRQPSRPLDIPEDFELGGKLYLVYAITPSCKGRSLANTQKSLASWLYVIEGLISISVVAWAWFGLPEDPTRAKFWKPEEKEVMLVREMQRQEYLGSLTFEWAEVGRALKDPKVWVT